MSNEKSKPSNPKAQPAPVAASPVVATSSPKLAPTSPPSGRVEPLFRKVDWLTFLISFAFVFVGYYFTLAPELTLEDSGELAVGSMYAGIPHPPGYPVWTLYTWLWTVLLPINNIAWRVALAHATSGAIAAGLLGFLVSRGSSLLMEGIEELKAIVGTWGNAICMVSGFVAAGLIGFNGYLWSQSIIVEVYSFGVASFMVVMVFLLRWIYAPHQYRYLYYALFFHGISFTNHQTLIVAAMGIEVAIAAAHFRMGRFLFLGNSIIFLGGLFLKQAGILTALGANPAIFTIFIVIGVASIAAYGWFLVLTKPTFSELCLDASLAAFFLLLSLVPMMGIFGVVLALGALAAAVKFALETRKFGLEWLVVIVCGICWIAGAAFYFYMPLAGMTNPPMQWGYPRTVEGFIHAFTRGQYEKTNPSDVFGDPFRFITQLGMLGRGIVEEFNWLFAFLALIPFLFFRKLHRRERAWLVGLTAIYLCLGVLLLILLNPPPDRAAQELVRVFFTASHTVIAMLVGYGITLVAAYMATHYQRFRWWGLVGGGVAVALSIVTFAEVTTVTFFGETAPVDFPKLISFVGQVLTDKYQYGLPVFAGLLLIGTSLVFVLGVWLYRERAPLAISLAMFALMPAYPVLTHWSNNEQRNHWFGYWFGHDMFTPPFTGADGKPLYPEMTKDAVLYGGTDPGRFCPTYMIFADSFLDEEDQPAFDKKFDRRDVYIITQNALADGTYLNYIRAHYNRSTQIDPPFFQELFRSERERTENFSTNGLAMMVRPLDRLFTGIGDRIEKRRRTFTSWFEPEHFSDLSGFAAKVNQRQDKVSAFIYENLSQRTQQLLAGKADTTLAKALCEDLNRFMDRELAIKAQIAEKKAQKSDLDQEVLSGRISESGQKRLKDLEKQIAELAQVAPLYTAERFQGVAINEYLADFIKENPQSHTRVRLNRLLLEAAYPKEIKKSKGGVYPDREMYIASAEDSQQCFSDYLADAQRRLQLNQLKPGEDVRVIDNKVQVSGQVAVMAINGLITKVMFEKNPKNEFFVEESFPLDWMFPHLTPFGIIMKINRQPLTDLTEDIVKRDHEFWTKYSERLIGNWITYDTTVKEIADFVERVYLRRNFKGFTGDRKFVRDDQAQKAFSKLRSSIGGVYNWRIANSKPGSPEQARMIKEADFAFRQALAFCPYSPEAVFRYVNLLLSMQRFDDALIVASTCEKLDPYNGQVVDLVRRLREFKNQAPQGMPVGQSLPQLEKAVADNPSNLQSLLNLAAAYLQQGQTNHVVELLDKPLASPTLDANGALVLAQVYAQIGNYPKLETALERLVKLSPESAEAWYDLAAIKAALGKLPDAMTNVRRALELSAKRRAANPNARDIQAEIKNDPRFALLRQNPEFQKLMPNP